MPLEAADRLCLDTVFCDYNQKIHMCRSNWLWRITHEDRYVKGKVHLNLTAAINFIAY